MTKKNKLVLIVDDDPAWSSMLGQAIQFIGYNTLSAKDGEEALHRVHESPPDIIILDIMMPKMDGWEVCRRLKADPVTHNIPVLVYSTLSDKKDCEKGTRLGVSGYIGKEKDISEVLAVVKTHLEK